MNGGEVSWKFLDKKLPTLAPKSNLLSPWTGLSGEGEVEAQKQPPPDANGVVFAGRADVVGGGERDRQTGVCPVTSLNHSLDETSPGALPAPAPKMSSPPGHLV